MLGIVILNYKTYKKTIECVESILDTYQNKMAVYIIDNNSPNDSFEILKQRYQIYDYIKVIKVDSNGGFAKGNNVGLKAALEDECEYVILSNNDILFCEKSIENLYACIRKNVDSVIVGPKIYKPDGMIQHSTMLAGKSYAEYLGLDKLLPLGSKKESLDENFLDEEKKVYSVSGCCFIINLKLFIHMGAFDEGTFLYNEENILSLQANENGYHTYFLPSASIIHVHGATAGKQNMFINQEFIKSAFYYWGKYRNLNDFLLIIMWLSFTLKWFIKSLYCKDLKNGWKKYFLVTWNELRKEIKRKG